MRGTQPCIRYPERYSARPAAAGALRCRDKASMETVAMTPVYNVIDADGHILEPLNLWDKYLDPKFRNRAPRLVTDPETGKEKLDVEGQLLGSQQGMGGIGGGGARPGAGKTAGMK